MMALRRVALYEIRYDRRSRTPVLILKDTEKDLYLPVWIGELEAASIEIAVLKKNPGRPLTHDLLINILSIADITIERIDIPKLTGHTYYASIIAFRDGERIEIDTRPSDGIAIAFRLQVPVFVEEELMFKLDMEQEKGEGEPKSDSIDDFKEFLKNVSPQDFEEGTKGEG